MSHAQYTAIAKTRLTDLAELPAGLLLPFLATRPEWFRNQILNTLSRKA